MFRKTMNVFFTVLLLATSIATAKTRHTATAPKPVPVAPQSTTPPSNSLPATPQQPTIPPPDYIYTCRYCHRQYAQSSGKLLQVKSDEGYAVICVDCMVKALDSAMTWRDKNRAKIEKKKSDFKTFTVMPQPDGINGAQPQR